MVRHSARPKKQTRIEREVYRLAERPPFTPEELDLFWYLWSGPESPLFGKDRITAFERDLIADPRTHHETKNPYFQLIHEAWFCDKILAEFGVDPSQGMIVDGHAVSSFTHQMHAPDARSSSALGPASFWLTRKEVRIPLQTCRFLVVQCIGISRVQRGQMCILEWIDDPV